MAREAPLERLPATSWLGPAASVITGLAVFYLARHDAAAQLSKMALITVGLAVTVAAVSRPHLALLAVALGAAFDQSLTLLGWQTSTATVTLLVLAPAFGRSWRPAATPGTLKVGLAALSLGYVVGSVVATDVAAAFAGTLRYLLSANMIMGAVGMLAQQPNRLSRLATVLAVAGTIVAILGWLQARGRYVFVGPPFIPERIDSTFGWYSNFATFEAITALISVGLLLHAWQHRSAPLVLVALAGTITSLYAVAIALSRGAVLMVVGGIILSLVRTVRRPATLLAAVGGFGASTFLVLSLSTTTALTTLEGRFRTSQGGDVTRRQLQSGGTELMLSHPLGIGFDNLRSFVTSGQITAAHALAHAHSLFIQTGLDAGWLGLAGLLALTVFAVLRVARGIFTADNSLRSSFAVPLVMFLLEGSQDYFFFEVGSLIVFGLLVAGTFGVHQPRRRSDQLTGSGDLRASPSQPARGTPRHAPATRASGPAPGAVA